MSQVAERYARAAWDVAQKKQATQALVASVEQFAQLLAASEALQEALKNPAFAAQRAPLLAHLLEKSACDGVAAQLLKLLLDNERLLLVPAVLASLQALACAQAGKLRAQVVTAVPLQPKQLKRLEEVLSKRMGQPVVAETKVTPALVAGMICTVGKLTFDSSLKQQLAHFAAQAGAARA